MGCVTDPESAVSPLLTHVAGASAQDGTGVGGVTARHYGEPLVEQLRLERGPGVVDGWDRTAVLVTGPEAATWLNTLTSQKLDALATGAATSSLILDIQGRVLHHFGVSALPDGLLLDTPTTAAAALAGYLRSMVFWAKVEVTVPDLTRLTVVGAPGTPGRCGTGSPADPVVPGAVAWTSRRLGGYDAVDVWVPRDGVTAAWDALT
ncbi:folate-binding protein YgfZ, partial [Corynebacterium bovis]